MSANPNDGAKMPFPFHVTIVTVDLSNIDEGNILATPIDDIGPAFGNCLFADPADATTPTCALVDARLTAAGKVQVDAAFASNANFHVYYGENSRAVACDDLAIVPWQPDEDE